MLSVAFVIDSSAGSRAELAKRLGIRYSSLKQWVTIGHIPSKYLHILSGAFPLNIENPEFRALFHMVEAPPWEDNIEATATRKAPPGIRRPAP